MLMIDTADVKKEFMLADAKANMGKEVEFIAVFIE